MSGCLLVIDNFQYGQFLSGGIIQGRVICSFHKPKSIRGIRVKFKGREHTEWIGHETHYNHHTKRNEQRTVYFTGNNTFLGLEQTLSNEGDYPIGRHEYHFTFSIPEGIPSTFYGKYGWIKYTIKAVVDRPFKTDYDDKRELIVISPINLNGMPGLQMHPLTYTDEKTLCCFCCSRGIITMNVYLEKEAFVQGETARVKMSIQNMSTENVTRIELKIKITTQYKVTLPRYDTKYDKEILVYTTDGGVGAHGERNYDFLLKIPETAIIPNFSLCNLFEKWASLKVTAVLNGVHRNMEISIPITLGHIPLGAHQTYQMPPNPPYPTVIQYPVNPYIPPDDQGVYTVPLPQTSISESPASAPSEELPITFSTTPSKAEIMMEEMIRNTPPSTAPPSYSEAVKYATQP